LISLLEDEFSLDIIGGILRSSSVFTTSTYAGSERNFKIFLPFALGIFVLVFVF